MNAYLETLQVKIHEAHRELLAANAIVTPEKLKNKLAGKSDKRPRMLLEVFSEHNKKMIQRNIPGKIIRGYGMKINVIRAIINGRKR